MEKLEEEQDEVVIIQNRDEKIKDLLHDLLSGAKSLSYSSLKNFAESPEMFIQYCLQERKQTDAMLFGTIVHCLVLEPMEFNKRYFVLDDAQIVSEIGGGNPRLTKVYKEWKALQIDNNRGKEMVKPDIYRQAEAIANNVKNNRASRSILSRCNKYEVKLEWEFDNFKFKGIKDAEGKNCIMDLKTMKSAEPRKAQRDIIEMKYYLQAAMYLTGSTEKKPYYIVAVDRKGGVSVHKINDDLMEYGFQEYKRLLAAFNDCLLRNHFDRSYDYWSQLENGIFICERPAYLYKEL